PKFFVKEFLRTDNVVDEFISQPEILFGTMVSSRLLLTLAMDEASRPRMLRISNTPPANLYTAHPAELSIHALVTRLSIDRRHCSESVKITSRVFDRMRLELPRRPSRRLCPPTRA